MQFELTDEDIAKVKTWRDEQDQIVLERQRASVTAGANKFPSGLIDDGHPYYGAIGGALTYSFTPTSIGTVTTVTHGATGEVLNLTDYDNW